jgi:hypothetical protein
MRIVRAAAVVPASWPRFSAVPASADPGLQRDGYMGRTCRPICAVWDGSSPEAELARGYIQ